MCVGALWVVMRACVMPPRHASLPTQNIRQVNQQPQMKKTQRQQRIAIGREEVMLAARDDPSTLDGGDGSDDAAAASSGVAALSLKGNFMFDAATHRDFLGALLGTGVVRDRVGDILVAGDAGCAALVDAELVEHFEAALTQVCVWGGVVCGCVCVCGSVSVLSEGRCGQQREMWRRAAKRGCVKSNVFVSHTKNKHATTGAQRAGRDAARAAV